MKSYLLKYIYLLYLRDFLNQSFSMYEGHLIMTEHLVKSLEKDFFTHLDNALHISNACSSKI